jgi:hypothetical protein
MRRTELEILICVLWFVGGLLLIFAVMIRPPIPNWPEAGILTPSIAFVLSVIGGFGCIGIAKWLE